MRPRLLSTVKSLVAIDDCTLKYHLLHDSSCAAANKMMCLERLAAYYWLHNLHHQTLQVLDSADGSVSLKCALLLSVSRKASAAAPRVRLEVWNSPVGSTAVQTFTTFTQFPRFSKCFNGLTSNLWVQRSIEVLGLQLQGWSEKFHLQVFQLRLLLGIELC